MARARGRTRYLRAQEDAPSQVNFLSQNRGEEEDLSQQPSPCFSHRWLAPSHCLLSLQARRNFGAMPRSRLHLRTSRTARTERT